jgi:hypothetical protein
MKKQLLSLFVLASGILIGGGLTAQAQLGEDVKVDVPFSFHAAGKEFPAGSYTIRRASLIDDSVLEIQSDKGGRTGIFETEQSDISATMKTNEVIFNHVGDEYFLAQIVDADDGTGAEIPNPDNTGKHQSAAVVTDQKHILAKLRIP